MPIHNIYKPIGWSSCDVMTALKKWDPDLEDLPMTYTGRLDPMAEGVMVILSGEHRYKKPEFQKFEKTYKATFLFGVESDTYDCLGLIKEGEGVVPEMDEDQVKSFLLGTHPLPFPPYSSYRIKGKPLHFWAQTGRLDEVEIPVKEMGVLKVEDVRIYEKPLDKVKQDVIDRIQSVRGVFRQEEIIDVWKRFQSESVSAKMVDCTLTVISGTYIRALAHEMGRVFGSGGVLFSLNRVSVDSFVSMDSIKLSPQLLSDK